MDSPSVDLKKTVNLPKTDFSMKANLPQTEPVLLKRWQEEGLYERIRSARAGAPRFVLHDGPPYANGNIHLGHAFNKLLKDFIVKSKSMAGFDSPYIPGWDCHGLPIEIRVDAELGSKKAQMSLVQIRQACRKYAEKYVRLQSEDFQRLGVFGRWSDPYLTMSAPYEAAIARAFVDFLDQGYVYKGLKPVNWCLSCRTTLAEAEVEYENHVSPSIYVRFALKSDAAAIDPALAGRNVYGLIWTTTPWTIPANLGISYHPKFEYAAVDVNGDVYIVAQGLLETVTKELNWQDPQTLATFPGAALDRAVFRHPFLDRESLGMVGDHVTLEQGTGAVHTAPGHGMEDFIISQLYGIPTYCPVDVAGRFYHIDGVPGRLPEELIGLNVWQANPVVIGLLKAHGALLLQRDYTHSYPHCWRCHKPTIFRGTEQWFIGMEKNDLRTRALAAIKEVKWMPSWGDDRMTNMIAMRPDWVISRQRTWGVPITVFYCETCNTPLTEKAVLDKIIDRFEKETADVWYAHEAAELLGPGVHCSQCRGTSFRKEMDILDVWFESGCSHLAVLTPENDLSWPSDLYLEGGDQYRGWFHSSLLVGVGLKGGAPYRGSVTNGWTLDGEGRAMSKSLGNVIAPEEIIKKFGAEVLRLWVSSVEFNEDVRMSPVILDRLSEAYRKIRNTFRYALGNLHGFDPVRDAVPTEEMREIDQWILVKAAELTERCLALYNEYAFHRVYQALYNFASVELSSIYFDVLKDRLYTSATQSHARRSAQTALYRLTHGLLRLIAPILAFTSEEAWKHMAHLPGDPESVHLALFPSPADFASQLSAEHRARLANWDSILAVRETVTKQLEISRQEKFIGAPLEAKVILSAGPEILPLLTQYLAELPSVFITSQVELLPAEAEGVSVVVAKADGVKCERCWKYTLDTGADPRLPSACAACASAVVEMLSL
jgi:isoleucyl-tRNA synthetase